ncbi:hypothetical protein [Nocardia sp. NPDC052112]|uniref:alpha/beta hydrolase family esterase n=1 Tax=Nocardia sp. NPDC052112 TaxID=3155646 RepID=UPI00343788E3
MSAAATFVMTVALVCGNAAGAEAPNGTDPVASAGCASPAVASGTSTGQFAAAGKSGTYVQDVPAGTAGASLPVVVDLHGYLEPAQIERFSTGVGQFGIEHGFATITPQLDDPGWPRWDFSENSGDVAYLSELLTHVESTLCVDLRRVFVTGLSMGGFTTSSLACQLADRIAAVAPVAGLQDFAWCHPARPVPVIAFHGTADPIVAYTGGPGPNAQLLPSADGSGSAAGRGGTKPSGVDGPGPATIPTQAAAWAHRNGCGPEPQQRQIAADVTLFSYPCPGDGAVELYAVLGGGHTWPGSPTIAPEPLVGTTTASINANQVIWDFFQAHPRSGPLR